jgi:hypothetical protein
MCAGVSNPKRYAAMGSQTVSGVPHGMREEGGYGALSQGLGHTTKVTQNCLSVLNLSQSHWFRKSQLTSMVAIGLQKPYAKMKVGES